MPRKIPDLEATILQKAEKLFMQEGYVDLDMKKIAKACGTSVGNLYNYFSSKTDLFLAASSAWIPWIDTEYNQLQASDKTPLEKLEAFLFRFVEVLQTSSGLWEEVFSTSTRDIPAAELQLLRDHLRQISQAVTTRVDDFLAEIAVEQPKVTSLRLHPDKRLACCLLSTTKLLSRRFPDENEANQNFIRAFLGALTH
jgi:AcrR family transcriptional regulator